MNDFNFNILVFNLKNNSMHQNNRENNLIFSIENSCFFLIISEVYQVIHKFK